MGVEILNTIQAAAELGMTPRGIRKAIESGHLQAQRVGRDYAILRRDVDKYKKQPAARGRPRGSKNVAAGEEVPQPAAKGKRGGKGK